MGATLDHSSEPWTRLWPHIYSRRRNDRTDPSLSSLWRLCCPHQRRQSQLPPEVRLDQLLLRVERLVEADDLDAAVRTMEEALAFGAEHELELPPDFRLDHSRTEFAVGLLGAAKESVTAYLAGASREAASYLGAVGLLEDVDRILERRDAPLCSPLPQGSPCWMELTSHPECYVWNPAPQATETATWTGECSAGFAQGPGTVTWTYRDGEQNLEGNWRYGQPHGESVIRDHAGWVSEGPYRFGKERGHWIVRFADGGMHEGPYMDGRRHGHWVLRFASGSVQEGPYEDGEKNGHWVLRFTDARGTQEGPYVNGTMQGHWVLGFTDNRGIQEGPYMDGKMHGHWVLRFASGTVEEGLFVDGERQGRWLHRQTDGSVGEGPYVDDERNGHWVWRWPDEQVQEGPYVNGEKHGRWRTVFPDGEVTYEQFMRGVRQKR